MHFSLPQLLLQGMRQWPHLHVPKGERCAAFWRLIGGNELTAASDPQIPQFLLQSWVYDVSLSISHHLQQEGVLWPWLRKQQQKQSSVGVGGGGKEGEKEAGGE